MFLNCCSVNGPRGFGMLGDWAVMRERRRPGGQLLRSHAGRRVPGRRHAGDPRREYRYPLDDVVRLKIVPQTAKQFTLALRFRPGRPRAEVLLNGQSRADGQTGEVSESDAVLAARRRNRVAVGLGPPLRIGRPGTGRPGVALSRAVLLSRTIDSRAGRPATSTWPSGKERRAVPSTPIDPAAGPSGRGSCSICPPMSGKTLRLIDFASTPVRRARSYESWLPGLRCAAPQTRCLAAG